MEYTKYIIIVGGIFFLASAITIILSVIYAYETTPDDEAYLQEWDRRQREDARFMQKMIDHEQDMKLNYGNDADPPKQAPRSTDLV